MSPGRDAEQAEGRARALTATDSCPYRRPLFSASKTFFTCCALASGHADPFRSVPYILEGLAGMRALTELLWMDFLWERCGGQGRGLD